MFILIREVPCRESGKRLTWGKMWMLYYLWMLMGMNSVISLPSHCLMCIGLNRKVADGTKWRIQKIGEVPATSHKNSQGFEKGQIIAGGTQEILIAGDGNVYCFEVPDKPEKREWPRVLIGRNTSDEGIGLGDIDGDGDLDLATGRRPENGPEPLIVVWFENPGSLKENWESVEIGNTNHPIDRVEIADLNGDSKADIIITEERYPGLEPDGNLFWYESAW